MAAQASSIFTIENDCLLVTVRDLGAEIVSVRSKLYGTEYIWQADQAVWPRHAPLLFPIVGRLKNNTYCYNGSAYPLPQHGFARDTTFTCVEQAPERLVFELTANETSLRVFPFHFCLQVIYGLEKDQLNISYRVFNPDNHSLYFSLGAHPGFNCPLAEGDAFEDYVLEFPGLDHLTCTKLADGLTTDSTYTLALTNNRLSVSRQLFSNDALVLSKHQVRTVSLLSLRSGRGVEVHCKDWPHVGIWTKSHTGKFICLEPWHGIADHEGATGQLEEKQGIICLLPEQEFACHYTTRFF